jgi:hypothetical protein
VLVVVLVLENPDRFAIRLTEQNISIGLFAVMESQCTEDEHDDEEDSKFRNLGLKHRLSAAARSSRCKRRTSWRGPSHTFPRPVGSSFRDG